MRLRGPVAAAALVSASACSLVLDANVHDPEAVAASQDAGDASSSTGRDGGGVVDGDAAGAGDAGRPDGSTPSLTKGCAFDPPRRFCEDFEDGGLTPTWDLNNPSTKVEYDSLSFAGSRAVKMAMTAAPACSFARIDKNWENTKATALVETHFKVRPSSSAISDNGEVNLLALQLDKVGSPDFCSAILSVAPDRVSVSIQIPPTYADDRHVVNGKVPFDAWSEVGIKVVAGTPLSIVVTLQTEGGAVEETSFPAPQCPSLGGAVRLGLGLHCESGTAEARYDDVWVDWR